jgi:hypothetical protein
VKNWVKETEARLQLVFLPSYSPEINPEELLNQDINLEIQVADSQLRTIVLGQVLHFDHHFHTLFHPMSLAC